MTQKNNENTKFIAGIMNDSSSNHLSLMMAGAGLIGYTLYNKYKTNCSLDGKVFVISFISLRYCSFVMQSKLFSTSSTNRSFQDSKSLKYSKRSVGAFPTISDT